MEIVFMYTFVHDTIVNMLAHWSMMKMADISLVTFSDAFSWKKSFVSWSKFHWSLFHGNPIDNKSVLVQVMAWSRTGSKPLPEQMMI